MTATASPAVLRRWIAFELRRLRMNAGYTQPGIAEATDSAESRISHIESRRTLPKIEFVEKLLRCYGAADQVEKFRELLSLSRKKSWWHGLSETREPSGFDVYLGLEEGASRIDWYEPLVLPGLLQTEDYARAFLAPDDTRGFTTSEIERRLELRQRRQDVLERDEPTHLWTILTEHALERPVGGTGVMQTQLDHLLAATEMPNVQIQVIPKAVGIHRGLNGPFTILHFPMPDDPGVVYIETMVRAVWFEDQAEVDQYEQVMNHLRTAAADPRESRSIIEKHREEW